jgi:hypothetical protein
MHPSDKTPSSCILELYKSKDAAHCEAILMDANEILKRYAIRERDFKAQDLHRLKLANTNFRRANFLEQISQDK